MKNLQHWSLGGTGITNFKKESRPRYEKAIELHGDTSIYIQDEPIGDYKGRHSEWLTKRNHSLHCSERKDLSAFWKVFDSLEVEFGQFCC